jgi:hypothetical protein
VKDTVVQINREEKKIILNSTEGEESLTIFYEYLILSPGLQYYANALGVDFGAVPGVHGMNRIEWYKIKPHLNHIKLENDRVVIYGQSLQAYTAANCN